MIRLRITNLGEFQRASAAAVDAAMLTYVEALREGVSKTFDFIVASSPVLTGRYRASHTVSVGTPDFSTVRIQRSSAEFAALISNPLGPPEAPPADLIRLNRIGQPVIFANGVPYADGSGGVEDRHRVYDLGRQACEKFLVAAAARVASKVIS